MWLFLANGMQAAAASTMGGAGLISKVHFPRLVIPIASIVPAVIDFLVGFVVVFIVVTAYGFDPRPQILLLPVLILLSCMTMLGMGLWLAALNVKYRDVILLIPFVVQVGLFITPIVYPMELVPDNLQPLYVVNPTVGLLELFRWMILPTALAGLPTVDLDGDEHGHPGHRGDLLQEGGAGLRRPDLTP